MSEPDHDEQDNAESFDEDLLVEEGADDTDVASQYPPDHYEAVFEPGVTPDGDARVETLQERVLREEADPLVAELDRNALAEELEDESYRAAAGGDDPDVLPLDVQLAEIEDAALDNEVTGGTG